MDDLSQNDRSKLRVAAICLTHCERFRLLRLGENEPDAHTLMALATEVLDLFEQRVAYLPKKQATENPSSSSTGAQPYRRRKKVAKSVLGD